MTATFSWIQQKIPQWILLALLVVPLLLLIKLVFQLPGQLQNFLFPANEPKVEIKNIILGGINATNELTTADMSTKATIHVSQQRKISRFTLGDTHVVYEGVGVVQAGIDMNKIEIQEADSKQHKLHIILPAPRITQAMLDINDSHVIVKYQQWWGPNVAGSLQEQAQKKALEIIKTEACTHRILDQAANHAKDLVTQIVTKTSDYQKIIVEVKSNPPGTCPTVGE